MIGRRPGKLKRIARFLAPAGSFPSPPSYGRTFRRHGSPPPLGCQDYRLITGQGDCLGRDVNSGIGGRFCASR
jgi:hypothetical protein